MSTIDPQYNNPLHGVKLDTLLTELISHYGFDILAEYTKINCFKNRPSYDSSLKFLKKTEWAREKLERFYLYDYKNLPKADDSQFDIPPRKRIIPSTHKPRAPKVLIAGQAPQVIEKTQHTKNQGSYGKASKDSKSRQHRAPEHSENASHDPWANSPK